MAIYHCSVKIIGRSSGRSSVAASAYRAGVKIKNERDGITHNYTRKIGVVHSEIMLPASAPKHFKDRATLWNAVEKSEKRSDSQTAREVEVALPIEFSLEENVQVLRSYITKNFTTKGMIADFSIHDNRSKTNRNNPINPNPHAHIMLTMREVHPEGFEKKNRTWNKTKLLEQWRENWAKACNDLLKQKSTELGLNFETQLRIDHRSLEAQGLERTPTIHYGYSKTLKALNDEIIKSNEKYKPQNIAQYMNELNEVYTILKNHTNEINKTEQAIQQATQQELTKIEDNIKAIQQRYNDILKQYQDLQQAKTKREELHNLKSSWRNKRELDKNKQDIDRKIENMEQAYKHSWDYFGRSFNFAPDQAHNEIKRLKSQHENIIENHRSNTNPNQSAPTPIHNHKNQMQSIEKEYKRQHLLTKIRPDKDKILTNLDPADMNLNKITPEQYKDLTQDMTPSQVAILENIKANEANIEHERYNQTKTLIRFREFDDLVR